MSQQLVKMAQEAVQITSTRQYRTPSGRMLKLPAEKGSTYHPPDEPLNPLPQMMLESVIQVTEQSTLAAMRDHQDKNVAALNFASAKNPGGGFLRGTVAQEESIARSSTLYGGLNGSPYYEANRQQRSGLYTDGIVYSPEVWVFRDDHGRVLEQPYKGAIITSPAVNMGALMSSHEHTLVPATMARRGRRILEVAAHHGTEVLILGAWGCGVFGNDPYTVATMFEEHLGREFSGIFDKVVFPIYRGGPSLWAFQEVFGG